MKRVAILGTGEFASFIVNECEALDSINIVGFYDGNQEKGIIIDGYPVLGNDDNVVQDYKDGLIDYIFIGIGYEHFDIREKLYNRFNNNVPFATIVHPTAIVNPTAKIGSSVLISEGVIIGKDCVIEDDVTIKPGALISHDGYVGKHCYLAPRVAMAGKVTVGDKCFLGVNCSIRDGIIIGDEVTVGIGCVVNKNIGNNEVVVGNPQRTIRYRSGAGYKN